MQVKNMYEDSDCVIGGGIIHKSAERHYSGEGKCRRVCLITGTGTQPKNSLLNLNELGLVLTSILCWKNGERTQNQSRACALNRVRPDRNTAGAAEPSFGINRMSVDHQLHDYGLHYPPRGGGVNSNHWALISWQTGGVFRNKGGVKIVISKQVKCKKNHRTLRSYPKPAVWCETNWNSFFFTQQAVRHPTGKWE